MSKNVASGSFVVNVEAIKKGTESELNNYALSVVEGEIVFSVDTKKYFEIINSTLVELGSGSGSGTGIIFTISQTSHGFSVLTPIYHNGTSWQKAKANVATTLATHVVTEVTSANEFKATNFGKVTAASHGLTVGQFYYVSTATAGAITSTEPTSGFSNPVLYVEDASNVHMLVYRPSAISTTMNDVTFAVTDSVDTTKYVQFDVAGSTATRTMIQTSQTANRTITLPDATDTLVGKNTIDTLTNKTITGATIQTPARLDLKQDTKANLTTYALTASNGQLVFATDSKEYFAIKDGLLVDVGGGAGVGSTDLMVADQADKSALTDYTQTGLEIIETPIVLHGTKSFRLQHTTSIKSFKKVMAVDRKFRGKNMTVWVDVSSTATEGNLNIQFRDETNSANIGISQSISTGSQTITATTANGVATLSGLSSSDFNKLKVGMIVTGSAIPVGTTIISLNSSTLVATMSQNATGVATGIRVSALVAKKIFTFDLPANCSSVSWTISSVVENYTESYLDDIVIQLTSAPTTSASITQITFNNTAWTTYTPTISSGFGTTGVTNNTAQWRQNGEMIEVRGTFTAGSVGASIGSISLPPSYTLDTTKLTIASNTTAQAGTAVGHIYEQAQSGAYLPIVTCPGTSTSLVYAGGRVAAASILVPENVTLFASSNQVFSYSFSFPAAGITASTTTTTTIPLASSVLVTQPDSQMTWQGYAGLGSTRTKIPYFTNARSMTGSAISYTTSTANGLEVTLLEDGYYDIALNSTDDISGSSICGIGLDLTDFTTSPGSRLTDSSVLKVAYGGNTSNRDGVSVQWSGPLKAGQKIYPMLDTSMVEVPQYLFFSISKAGSLKQLNPSSDSKIAIPTHQLRFEGATAKGSTDTAVVKFDTQTITSGDAWDVVNTAANGTVVTVKKAGLLTVNSSLLCGDGTVFLTKNQATLNANNPTSSEVLSSSSNAVSRVKTLSWSGSVIVGDKIRVSFDPAVTITALNANNFSLSLQEQSVAVALQNVTPTYDNSDSAIRVQAGNGYGSTNTPVRRFSNTIDNFGTDITYVDSATLGASFTINTTGLYDIAYGDNVASTACDIYIAKNTTAVPTGGNLLAEIRGNSTYNMEYTSCSTQVYLQKGDVIRAITSTAAGLNTGVAGVFFNISRVGKTSGTVDVTPFVNMKTTDVEAIEALTATTTFGSINTGVPILNITKNTNLGVIQVISNSVDGTSFKALKDCEFKILAEASNAGAHNIYISRNSTVFTIGSVNGILSQQTIAAGAHGNIGATVKLTTGDVIRFQVGNSGTSVNYLTITATADNNATASPTQQVSSDTIPFVFKATAIDPAVDPIGTFNTYTYAANTNTVTIAASAPTQSVSSMNTNGIQVFARAFNAASTAASPARVDIVIGKGLKSKQVDAYFNSGKLNSLSIDYVSYPTTIESGTWVVYNEVNGILTIEAGLNLASNTIFKYAGLDITSQAARSSGYFVFNASKSPSLVTIPNLVQRVAYLKDVKTVGAGGGTSVATTWTTRDLNTIVDSTGIVTSLASNQFTLQPGTYSIKVQMPFSGSVATAGMARLRNITDGITVDETQGYSGANTNDALCVFTAEVTINSSKQFAVQYWVTVGTATYGLGQNGSITGENNVFTRVIITKIK